MIPRLSFVAAFGLLAAVLGVAYSQPPTRSQPLAAPPLPIEVAPTSPAVPVSLDQMLDQLRELRRQKAEIENKETQLTKAIQERAKAQAERMKRLGIIVPEVVPAEESKPRVGRIVIRGNADKDQDKICELLDLSAGGTWDSSMLDAAQSRLTKAGFKAKVHALPSDTSFHDILVTIGK